VDPPSDVRVLPRDSVVLIGDFVGAAVAVAAVVVLLEVVLLLLTGVAEVADDTVEVIALPLLLTSRAWPSDGAEEDSAVAEGVAERSPPEEVLVGSAPFDAATAADESTL
jgi:hypothetical protein